MDKVVSKIDKWHEDRVHRNRGREKFARDEDYIEAEKSPTDFSSSDEGMKKVEDSNHTPIDIQRKTFYKGNLEAHNLSVNGSPNLRMKA